MESGLPGGLVVAPPTKAPAAKGAAEAASVISPSSCFASSLTCGELLPRRGPYQGARVPLATVHWALRRVAAPPMPHVIDHHPAPPQPVAMGV
jgi:hypothetical protein